MKLPRIEFAEIKFSGRHRGDAHYTVPMPALKSILTSGRVKIFCTGKYTDDYFGDAQANFGRGEVSAAEALSYTEYSPWLSYFDAKSNQIRFCPYQGLGFDIIPTESFHPFNRTIPSVEQP